MKRQKRLNKSSRYSSVLILFGSVAVATMVSSYGGHGVRADDPGPCAPPNSNPIVCENNQLGNPAEEWDIAGAGDDTIQGFSTDISVSRGQPINFKIQTTAADYRLDIYRMGYYGGSGARKIATVAPSATLPQDQPACLSDPTTGLVDCGNWAISATWDIPATAVSGIYFAKVIRSDTGGASHIVFVVRDDASHSDLLFQTSDTTWQAYNQYGGNSLYAGSPAGRAYKVSYNRPLTVRGTNPEDSVFNAEYPMVRWLEANGYDVSYSSGADTDRRGAQILQHKVYLSVGHDEYWSGRQRTNVEAARAAGVNLAFFSGNEVFWKTRWESSISTDATTYRTLVCYKETHAGAKIDPTPEWTGTWRDPRFSPPSDGGRPENGLTGTLFMVNSGTSGIRVPAEEGKMRFWRNTSVATLQPGQVATMPNGTLGYEWDEDADNAFMPAGLVRLSDTTLDGVEALQDYGSVYLTSMAHHALTFYRAPSGAQVFGAGTVQWSWGLDSNHERGSDEPSVDMQQATVNLFTDMGVQPLTIQAGLSTTTQSTDVLAPSSVITSPAAGASLQRDTPITVSGTASDAGGGAVAAVDVSLDGGATWRRAKGQENWTFSWITQDPGAFTITSRAVDDSGNIEQSSGGITVTVSAECPCSLFSIAQTPTVASESDASAIELGMKFRASSDGYISGIRFYKGPLNVGVHEGHLWNASGTLLSSVSFVGETASGWQTANFPQPIAITAGATYVVSYHTLSGFYSASGAFFGADIVRGPLTAPSSGNVVGNGVYRYGVTGFPANTYNATNYWVDVVFVTGLSPDTTAPTVAATTPAARAANVAISAPFRIQFSEAVRAATVSSSTVELRDGGGTLVPSAVSYVEGSADVFLQPSVALAYSSTYSVTVKGGAAGVSDSAGNTLTGDYSWTFTTAEIPPPPPENGPGGPILLLTSNANPFTKYYAEILRAEGLNAFLPVDLGDLTPTILASHEVVILGEAAISPEQVSVLTDWVNGGGKLIAMRPSKALATLAGLTDTGTTIDEGYIKVDTTSSPGAGIVDQTMQFHGAADVYDLNGASAVASLYSSATAATTAPAVTLRSVGSAGGQVAVFTYDLARSIVYTRQGNPAWAAQERDDSSPIRSDDLFFGGAQTDYVDRAKIAIPQADEQQRLLANLLGHLTRDQKPVPRFWYFPRGTKAVVVMTGDDHASNGTTGQFEYFNSQSRQGCDVANWECVRSTSYIYPDTPITPAAAAAFDAQGFEIGVHITTNCANYTPGSLDANYSNQLAQFGELFGLPMPRTNRTHCIVWSDYSTQPEVAQAHGIRLDTNYYYWPSGWVNSVPGVFTGSAMPMRFAKADGTMIDVYQAATQMTDESDQAYPFTVDALLDLAVGPEGYYGAYVANMHTDFADHPGARSIVSSAQARGVPVISARQLLDWLDGRNRSSYSDAVWSGNTLTFSVSADSKATGLQTLLPATSGSRILSGVSRNGQPIAFTLETLKGMNYARFDSPSGAYSVDYTVDDAPPAITNVTVTPGQFGAVLTWTTDRASTSTVEYGTDAAALTSNVTSQTYAARHSAAVQGLAPATTYYVRVVATNAAGSTAISPAAASAPLSFATLAPRPSPCPCSIWTSSDTPAVSSAGDTDAVELGVKFRPTTNGYVTAIRFFKGAANIGVHTGSLWSSSGALLGTVTFTDELPSGWQQATLPAPVSLVANTTYVVSYHTGSGGYAADLDYFELSGVTSGALHALAAGEDGPNGLYQYGTGGFPTQSFSSANYWVDLVFETTLPPPSPPQAAVSDTTVSDFQTGSFGEGTSVTGSGDGEVVLTPRHSEEFSGSVLPAGWTSSPWNAGGVTSLINGHAAVDGALLTSDELLRPDQTLEFEATFAQDGFQHGGFALTFNESLWAVFSTGSGGELLARTHDGTTAINTRLGSGWLNAPHWYRIEWTSTDVTFIIDGAVVATHQQAITGEMRPAFSDFNGGGGGLIVDAVRLAPYATSGTFTSRVLDGGTKVNWRTVTSIVSVNDGNDVTLSIRFGDTPVPDATWSTFTTVAVGNASVDRTSRYAQYRVDFGGPGDSTPSLEFIMLRGDVAPPQQP
jgi:hypothetical protein